MRKRISRMIGNILLSDKKVFLRQILKEEQNEKSNYKRNRLSYPS